MHCMKRLVTGILCLLFLAAGSVAQAAEQPNLFDNQNYLYLGDRDTGGAVQYFLAKRSKMTDSNLASVTIAYQAAQMPQMGGVESYVYDFSNSRVKLVFSGEIAYGKIVRQTKENRDFEPMDKDFHFADPIYAFLHDPSNPNNKYPHIAPNAPAPQPAEAQHPQWDGFSFVSACYVEPSLSTDVTLSQDTPIRGIIIESPETNSFSKDGGQLGFYVNGGAHVGPYFYHNQLSLWNWDDSPQPVYSLPDYGNYSKWTGKIFIWAGDDGFAYVQFHPEGMSLCRDPQIKTAKYPLPEGVTCFNGICHVNGVGANVYLYK